jgi:hypothetical protein
MQREDGELEVEGAEEPRVDAVAVAVELQRGEACLSVS